MALQWAAALLKDSDRVRQGVDLFGRDAMLLGRVMVTLVRLRLLWTAPPWPPAVCVCLPANAAGMTSLSLGTPLQNELRSQPLTQRHRRYSEAMLRLEQA